MVEAEHRRYAMWITTTLWKDVFQINCSEHGHLGTFTTSEEVAETLLGHINAEHGGTVTNVVVR